MVRLHAHFDIQNEHGQSGNLQKNGLPPPILALKLKLQLLLNVLAFQFLQYADIHQHCHLLHENCNPYTNWQQQVYERIVAHHGVSTIASMKQFPITVSRVRCSQIRNLVSDEAPHQSPNTLFHGEVTNLHRSFS